VGEAEAVTVDVWLGVSVGASAATGAAAPTTVRSAAAAQMIRSRRRKVATMRRRSVTIKRDYRPGTTWVITRRKGCPARLSLLPEADERDGIERSIWISPRAGGRPMSSVDSAADDR
jgi:hypothetical protein